MIPKRKWKLKLLLIIVLFVLIFKIIPTLIISNAEKKRDLKNVNLFNFAKYINDENIKITLNEEKKYTFENNTILKVEISDFSADNSYKVKYNFDNTIKEQDINQSISEIIINFIDEKVYEYTIEIYCNDSLVKENSGKIAYIEPYINQFAEVLNNDALTTHFGWDYNFDEPDKIDLIKNLGVTKVRDNIRSHHIAKNGIYDYSRTDKWINALTNNGIQLIAIFGPFDATFIGEDNKLSSQEEIDSCLSFFRKFNEHYPQIKDYELWNEPNYKYKTDEEIGWIAKMEVDSYKLLKEIDKNIDVLGTGMAAIGDSSLGHPLLEYYNKLVESDKRIYTLNKNFTYHVYDWSYQSNLNASYKAYIRAVKNLIEEKGGWQTVNVTEFGINSHNRTQEEQAQQLVEQSVINDKNDVTNSVIYNFRNAGTDPNNNEHNFGIVDYEYLPKPAYYALKEYYQNTNGAEYIGEINLKGGLESHVYNKDGKALIVTWSTNSQKTISFETANNNIYDLYGKHIDNESNNVNITYAPIYIKDAGNQYFYDAISNTATKKIQEYNEKYKNEINLIANLKINLDNIESYLSSLKENYDSISENESSQKLKDFYNIGIDIMNAYKDGSLQVEYEKLSAMLSGLDEIGKSFEDLVTVTAKNRITNFETYEDNIKKAKSMLADKVKDDMIFANKIFENASYYYDKALLVNNLEENELKTGFINGKLLHSYELATWSCKFSEIYVKDKICTQIDQFINKIDKIKQSNNEIFENQNILNKYNELINSLLEIKNTKNLLNFDLVSNEQIKIYDIIETIVNEFENKGLTNIQPEKIEEITEKFDDLSNSYVQLLYNFTIEDDIQVDTIKENINEIIEKYNNASANVDRVLYLINKSKNIYQNQINNEDKYINFINKKRIIYIDDICDRYISNMINLVKDEISKITIEYDKDTNIPTNDNISVKIKYGPNSKIINNDGKNVYTYKTNDKFDFELDIKGWNYKVKTSVDNIIPIKIEDGYIKNVISNTKANVLTHIIENVSTISHGGKNLNLVNDVVSTGDILKTKDNKKYTIIVFGDITSSGIVTDKNLQNFRKYLVELYKFDEITSLAADANIDGKIDTRDLIALRKIMLGNNLGLGKSKGQGEISLNLRANTMKIKDENKVYLTVSLVSLKNIDTNEPIVVTGEINYNKNVFSNINITALNGWSYEYNDGKFVLDSSTIKDGTNIARITLDLTNNNENLSKIETVKFQNVEILNDDNLDLKNLNIEKEINLEVEEEEENYNGLEPSKQQETTSKSPKDDSKSIKDSITPQERTYKIEKVEDLTTAKDEKIPQTGSKTSIYIIVIVIIVLGIYFFIRYKKMFD